VRKNAPLGRTGARGVLSERLRDGQTLNCQHGRAPRQHPAVVPAGATEHAAIRAKAYIARILPPRSGATFTPAPCGCGLPPSHMVRPSCNTSTRSSGRPFYAPYLGLAMLRTHSCRWAFIRPHYLNLFARAAATHSPTPTLRATPRYLFPFPPSHCASPLPTDLARGVALPGLPAITRVDTSLRALTSACLSICLRCGRSDIFIMVRCIAGMRQPTHYRAAWQLPTFTCVSCLFYRSSSRITGGS